MNSESGFSILFDCYYFNLAWGLSIYGFFITSEGNVCRYGMQKDKSLPVFTLTDGKPDEFIAACREDFTVIDKIDSHKLREMASLIEAASRGKIEQYISSIDAGSTIFLAYITTEDERKEVILQQLGDMAASNQSPEVGVLIKWLNSYWKKVENMYLTEFHAK
jgi:hypothetical protein